MQQISPDDAARPVAADGDRAAEASVRPAAPTPGPEPGKPIVIGGWPVLVACLAVLAILAGSVRWLWQDYEKQTAIERSLKHPQYTETPWDALIPKDWDPLRPYRDAGIDKLGDADPRAIDLARRMRETLDNAPTVSALDGAMVRLSGYVVPLDMNRKGMRDFLLVPYFGACIHVPAPAANQLIHVRLPSESINLRSMDTVWVSGRLTTTRSDSSAGVSGYAMEAHFVDRRVVPGH